MPYPGKREEPPGASLSGGKRRRRRLTIAEKEAEKEAEKLKKAVIFCYMVGAAVSKTVLLYMPDEDGRSRTRREWGEHATDLRMRRVFERFYRMTEESFEMLADLLRETIQHKDDLSSTMPEDRVPPMEIRLAVALRTMTRGSSSTDMAIMFGLE